MNNKILSYLKRNNTKKVWFLVGGIFVMCALLIVYLNYKGNTHQKCPEDYGSDDESITQKNADFDKWTKEFYENYPDASLSDLSEARYDFYVKNNCVVAIKRYNDAKNGKADPEDMAIIDKVIDDAISAKKYISDLGFSFDYPKDFRVVNDSEESRLFIFPNSYNPESDDEITAVVISSSPNNPPITPMEWLESSYSGADLSKGYNKVNIDGQEAISLENNMWVVVNTPDDKYQISIAPLPFKNPNESLQKALSQIVSTMSFK